MLFLNTFFINNSSTMPSSTLIYKTHMEISFNHNHNIYNYITNTVKKNNNCFDNNFQICINSFGRYSYGLAIMKRLTYDEYIDLIDIINNNKLIDFNKIKRWGYSILDIIENDKIENFTNNYKKFLQRLYLSFSILLKYCKNKNNYTELFLWIFKNYKRIYNKNLNSSEFLVYYYFLESLELFHLTLIKASYKKLSKNCNTLFVIGDNLYIEYDDLLKYTSKELYDFFDHEVYSHSTLYIFNNNNFTLYDPDYDLTTENNIDKLKNYLELNRYIPIKLNKSIQSITDDWFCIFHCIRFILLINKFNININSNLFSKFIKKFEEFQKKQNRKSITYWIYKLVIVNNIHLISN